MTICRKCGKEIPDGQELCSDCQGNSASSGESYLDGLMQNVDTEKDSGSAASDDLNSNAISELLNMLSKDNSDVEEEEEEDNVMPDSDGDGEAETLNGSVRTIEPSLFLDNEEGGLFADGSGAEELADLELPEEPEPVPEEPEPMPEEPEPVPEEEPMPEEEPTSEEFVIEAQPEDPVPEEEPTPEEPVMEAVPEEESLMEDVPEAGSLMEAVPEEESKMEELPEESVLDEMPEDIMLEEDLVSMMDSALGESEADGENSEDSVDNLSDLLSELNSMEGSDGLTEDLSGGDVVMEDLSMEDLTLEEPVPETASGESSSVDEVFQEALSAVDYSEKESQEGAADDMALDSLGLDDVETLTLGEVESVPVAEPANEKKSLKKQKKKKEGGFFKRIFGNVVTDEIAAEEAAEREEEQAQAEAQAAEKEEKKQQALQAREEKAELAQAEKERKAAEKAEKAAAKAAEKEEKKRLKAEAAADEVVGKINPVGATIVMVLFGLICLAAILGSQMLSYSSSVSRAESDFANGNYGEAYESVAGVNVSEASQETVEKVRLCMKLQQELDSYTNYYKMKMYLESLDALMRGMRKYDADKGKADEYGILTQYNELKNQIVATLSDEFGVSEDQARTILGTENQVDYTAKLEQIIANWERKMKEDEK